MAQTKFGMQQTLDGETMATLDPIDEAVSQLKTEQQAQAERQQREQARVDVAEQSGQETLKSCACEHCVGIGSAFDFLEKKLCPAGKAAAKKKFDVYPSAYANGWAVQYCKGKFKGKKK
tara:strand:+ start:288 stop:644 length:357 start_codon:yes stop_codon:yes gene_type:complete